MDSKIKDKNLVIPQDFLFGEAEEDALPLDCGRKLRNVNIRYETYGKLDAAGSNAILILHALSGNAHVSGCLLYTSPSPRDRQKSRMPSSA